MKQFGELSNEAENAVCVDWLRCVSHRGVIQSIVIVLLLNVTTTAPHAYTIMQKLYDTRIKLWITIGNLLNAHLASLEMSVSLRAATASCSSLSAESVCGETVCHRM